MTLFAAAMRERFFRNFHISTICQQSHMSTNFKIFTMSIFQPFANNFACQPLSTFSTTCQIWRSPTMCSNFSDAFVGGRLARADKWENVVFGVVSTFQRFVNDWHFHHVHVWTICQQCRMPTNFNICNNVTWNDMNHFWGTIVSFTFFFHMWTYFFVTCHMSTNSTRLL